MRKGRFFFYFFFFSRNILAKEFLDFSHKCGTYPKTVESCLAKIKKDPKTHRFTANFDGSYLVDIRQCLPRLSCQKNGTCYAYTGKALVEAAIARRKGKAGQIPIDYVLAAAFEKTREPGNDGGRPDLIAQQIIEQRIVPYLDQDQEDHESFFDQPKNKHEEILQKKGAQQSLLATRARLALAEDVPKMNISDFAITDQSWLDDKKYAEAISSLSLAINNTNKKDNPLEIESTVKQCLEAQEKHIMEILESLCQGIPLGLTSSLARDVGVQGAPVSLDHANSAVALAQDPKSNELLLILRDSNGFHIPVNINTPCLFGRQTQVLLPSEKNYESALKIHQEEFPPRWSPSPLPLSERATPKTKKLTNHKKP